MIKYEITFEQNPAKKDLQILYEGLDQYSWDKIGSVGYYPLTFFLRDQEGVVVGGVHGNYGNFGWLYISILWVSTEVRTKGYGTQLMAQIEAEALKGGCQNTYLDTFSFQAVPFYQKLGYTIFGELEDFPVGHSRCFLRKRLVAAEKPKTPDGMVEVTPGAR